MLGKDKTIFENCAKSILRLHWINSDIPKTMWYYLIGYWAGILIDILLAWTLSTTIYKKIS